MSRRILLADDSVTIQKVIELTFMDEDFEVTAVSNGDEAVALLPQLQPEFVIADVHMPGANGYEVCRRAKALKPHVPVLLLVGTFEPFDEAQARSAGSDAFLKKPFDSQELLHLVQQLIDQPSSAATSAASAPAASASPVSAPASVFAAAPTVPTPLASLAPEPPAAPSWAEFELEAEPEPEPLSPLQPAMPTATAGFAWEAEEASPVDEPVFELEPADEISLDESLLPIEEHSGFGAPTPAIESPAEEPFSFGAGGLGSGLGETERVEAHAPWMSAPPPSEATPEERVGVPFGAAPLAESLSAVEHRIEDHAMEHEALPDLPDWESPPILSQPAAPTPPPVAAPAPHLGVGAVHLPAAPADRLSDEDVDRIARRLVELVGEKVVRDVAWEVVPDLAEVVIKDRLRQLESQVE
jgi:CheY-like chemotaxis protein